MAAGFWGFGVLLRHHGFGLFQIDRDQLRHALFGHGDAEQSVHARHGHGIVGDGDEAGLGALAHFGQHVAEPVHIGIVKRCIDLIK